MQDHSYVHLYFSNSVEELASILAENIQANMADDPFEFHSILIPNAPLQKWLQLQLADRLGSVLNIDYAFLEKGLWSRLQDLLKDDETLKLDQNQLQWRLVNFLKCEDLAALSQLKAYFTKDSQISTHKLWQLAGEIARLFLEYERNRPEMIQAWNLDRNWLESTDAEALEEEQRYLYSRLFLEQPHAKTEKTLVQFAEKLKAFSSNKGDDVKSFHVFGPSQLSVFHRRLLCQLGQYCKVYIYSLNVCAEYWEDLTTISEDKWLKRQFKLPEVFEDVDGEEIFTVDENPLLKAWGKPGREALKIFSDLEEECIHKNIEFQSFWLPAEKEPQSLLNSIQYDILQRQSEHGEREPLALDRSLQIAACPSLFREVEVVFNSIVKNLRDDSNLQLTDIAVLVSDIDKYKAAIDKVFEGNTEKYYKVIPYSLIDGKAVNESHYANAVALLFEIVKGEFTRKRILELFKNPCFQTRTGINDKDIDTCLKWCEQLNMFRDGTDEPFAFGLGLKRLRSGHILGQGLRFGGLESEETSNSELLSIFSYFVDFLHSFQTRIQGGLDKTAQVWQKQLVEFFEVCLAVPEAFPAELSIRTKIYEELQEFVDFSPVDLEISFEDIYEFTKNCLGGVPISRGMYLGSGITIASLQPMRPVPFKHIYLLGLGENEFPGALDKSNFDLRSYRRKLGDVSLPEKNMYLFLETLVCAREKLFLSYVSEDTKEDKLFNPSRVINDLINYCQDYYDLTLPIAELPLKSYERSIFDNEAQHDGWRSVIPKDAIIGQSIAAGVKEKDRPAVGLDLKLTNLSVIPIKKIAIFLANPADAYFKNNCHLPYLYSNDQSLLEDEPFSSDVRSRQLVFTTALEAYISDIFSSVEGANFATHVKQTYEDLQIASSLPQGVFGEIDFMEYDALAQKAVEKLGLEDFFENADVEGLSLGQIIIGETAWQCETESYYVDGLNIELDGQDTVLTGTLSHALWDSEGIFRKMFLLSVREHSINQIILPFLQWCLLYLSSKCGAVELVVFNLKRARPIKINFSLEAAGWESREELEVWFHSLMENFIKGQSTYLPISMGKKLKAPLDSTELKSLLEKDMMQAERIRRLPMNLLENLDTAEILPLFEPVYRLFLGEKK
jgi:exodeoxyribonuclease V gamma subunit